MYSEDTSAISLPMLFRAVQGGSIVQFTSLKDIEESSTIKVFVARVFSKSQFPGSRFRPPLQLVLIDEMGCRIEANINANLVWKSAAHVKEFATITMSKFKLTESKGSFKFADHTWKILVSEDTVINSAGDALHIPLNGLEFKEFKVVLSNTLSADCFFDVIGRVIHHTDIIKYEHKDKSATNRVEIELEDHSHEILPVTLWDDYAMELRSHMDSHKESTVIVILQFAKLTFYGKLGVSNAKWGSRLILDDQHPAIVEFKSGFLDGDSSSSTISHVSSQPYLSRAQKYLKDAETTTLAMLETKTENGYFTFVATIVDFANRDKWFYNACIKCRKAVATDGSSSHCITCDKPVQFPVQRFALQLKVQDDTGTGSLMMFDQDVQDIVHCTVTSLREKQARIGDVDAFPADFNILLNKSYLFTIEFDAFWVKQGKKAHRIRMMTTNVALIGQCKSSTLSLQESHSDVCSSGHLSLSTPKRRRTYVEVNSDDDDDAEGQLSTTKQNKVEVKIEPADA